MEQELPALDESKEVAQEALDAVIRAELAPFEMKGLLVTLEAAMVGDRRDITCRWDGGAAALRISSVDGIDRRSAVDRGHRLGLRVATDPESREVVWASFERQVRDAIRKGSAEAPLIVWNFVLPRTRSGENREAIRGLGRRAREVAREIGLPGDAQVALGSFDLRTRSWRPDPRKVLADLVTLALLKVHFSDRGQGLILRGRPIFSTAPEEGVELSLGQTPPPERLGGVYGMFGSAGTWLESLRTLLTLIQEEGPSEDAFKVALREQSQWNELAASDILRLLRILDLADVRDGQWTLGNVGLEYLESDDSMAIYRALVARHTGIEETLGFFVRQPGARSDDLRKFLNAVLAREWTATTQASRRAYWLVACGLLSSEHGRGFHATETGRALFATLGPEAATRVDEGLGTMVAAEHSAEEGLPIARGYVPLKAAEVDLGDLLLPTGLAERCCAALNSGKHLLLIGPPGTGKTTLGVRIAEHAAEALGLEEPLSATASADWTTYDTIGGWTQLADQTLAFRDGVVCRALRERRWLVLDEVNRADIDKSFGELFTVLAGGKATTPYTRREGDADVPVEIGPDCEPYNFGDWFRLIATMNVRDKASLYRLSYAFLRRFAVVYVPGLDDGQLRELAEREARALGLEAHVRDLACEALSRENGLGRFVELGPSMLCDVLEYAKQRGGPATRAVSEGIDLLVLPQLEGLEDDRARDADRAIGELFASDAAALAELRAHFRAGFPHLSFDA